MGKGSAVLSTTQADLIEDRKHHFASEERLVQLKGLVDGSH